MKRHSSFSRQLFLLAGSALLLALSGHAYAGPSLRAGAMSSPQGGSGATGASSTQTATAATAATSQAVQTAAMAQQAQVSLQHSIQAIQAMQAAQSAARPLAPGNLGITGLTLPAVQDGLATGGLVPDSGLASNGVANPVTTWINANTPTQTTTAQGQITVTVQQTAQQALLNWNTFNIGRNTTLNFDQSLGGANVSQWVAINKVAPAIAPSQILGAITAPGQVYVINQNGIIFGGSSQVNTGALVVSSLPINDNLVQRGLLNNPDLQFLFSQVNIPSGSQGPTPAFTPAVAPAGGIIITQDAAGNLQSVAAAGRDGDVIVQSGAQLSAPTNAEHVGGRIALIGPNVTNAGTISTPDGQTILAAGLQVGLTAHNTNDPTLRGLDVAIGKVSDSSYAAGATDVAGTAANTGLIEVPRGDVTMAGMNVNQNGVIDSSTSVALNGRIDLLADYNAAPFINGSNGFTGTSNFYSKASGLLTLGTNSLTQILPELSSTDTVVGAQLALSSLVNFQAQNIHLQSGATLLAPGASTPADSTKPAIDAVGVTLASGVNLRAGNWLSNAGAFSFFATNGQINLDQGSIIDVSGSQNVAASVSENIVTAQLLGTELANDPLQQNGPLRGQTITFDLRQTGVNADGSTWIGTPLADVSGYAGLVQHNVGELTVNGGSVALSAGNAVNLAPGATVNVSGGWINYQGATVQTTRVVSNGQIYDISQATPNLVYSGIYGGYTEASAKWGITRNYTNSLLSGANYDPGYLQGGNGGSLSITAPTMTLNGNLYGNSVAGANQRSSSAQLSATYAGASFLPVILNTQALPKAGTLSLNFQGQNAAVSNYPTYSPTPPKIDFDVSQATGDLVISSDLVNTHGFGNFTINNGDGSIFVPASVSLTAAPGGSITLNGANIDIEGKVGSSGGTLTFNVFDYSPYADSISPLTGAQLMDTPAADPARGLFILGATASLNTSGLVVDDRYTSSSAGSLPLVTNGGTIVIKSYSADFEAGSTLDVSGGIAVTSAGKLTYGNGGSLAILAGQDPNLPSIGYTSSTPLNVRPHLVLNSSMTGYSGTKGGSLTIQTPLIQVGGNTLLNGDTTGNTLLLQPDFFSQGGFGSFSLNGLGQASGGQYLPGVLIAPGTVITPVVQSWLAVSDNNGIALTPTTLPLPSQRTPASLTFNAPGVSGFSGGVLVRGDLVMGANAVIQTDPKGNVSLGGTTVALLGSIVAPGGTISVSGAKNVTGLFLSAPDDPLVTVDMGPDSLLSTAGTVEFTPNSYGYPTGSVLPGGSIAISGNILAEKGAVLDVSGASGILDVTPAQAGLATNLRPSSVPYVVTRIDSNGGSITLTGGQELFSEATLHGAAGGSSAQGGSLTVKSNFFIPQAQTIIATTPFDATLKVTQNIPTYTSAGIGSSVQVNGSAVGIGTFFADSFNGSGLDSLTLGGTVQFSGAVTIAANRSLNMGSSGIIYADSAVNLAAPYVALGQAFQGPLNLTQQTLPVFTDSGGNFVGIPAVNGTGSLTINAGSLIDIGNLSLQNIGNVHLVAANGDIRGDGIFDVAGDIFLTAGQIYPTTETTFTIAAYDHNGISGTVTIAAGGGNLPQLPLSAGGTLNVYASTITQGGVLRAPIGTINLGGNVANANPTDLLSGQTFNSARQLILTSGSVTSVSAVDPLTGQALIIPYGTNLNGVSWIDPDGNNITSSGNGLNAIPGKSINLLAADIDDRSGAIIDISGGGDLLSYRFVSGTGGTNDILASTASFAVIPGYSAAYAPYYSATDYSNGKLAVGEQVYLQASNGLPAGFYTLLPARYALLPGAFLVTPKSGTPSNSVMVQSDGSSIVPGYLFNGLNHTQTQPQLLTSFEVDSQAVVKSRAEYDLSLANTFLSQSALTNNVAVPRLPVDAGQLVLTATQAMTIQGTVSSRALQGGLGSEVDIASPENILINGSGVDASFNGLVLDSSDLSAFGADSLLIGGFRQTGAAGTTVTVTTNNLAVDNAGAPLTGPDLILTAKQSLTVGPGADIEQSGSLSSVAETLLLGNAGSAGSGDGALLRVSSDASAQIIRSGVDASTIPAMIIGANATISGNRLMLDSTYATTLDPSASLTGNIVSLNSGQISLELTPTGAPLATQGIILSNTELAHLQASTQALSLLSYSSIDIYGTGEIGSLDGSGQPVVKSLTLHAAGIRGFNQGGGTVSINAQNITIDNSPGRAMPGTVAAISTGSTLALNGNEVQLGGGANGFTVQGYDNLALTASGGVLVQGSGSFSTAGSMTLTTPQLTGATAAVQTIAAGGTLTINAPAANSNPIVTGGLGANLTLMGASVTSNSAINLPSGTLTLHATSGNVSVGGMLSVAGTAQTFNDLIKYTDGGGINLISDHGSVNLVDGGAIDVAANSASGNAGSLFVSAPEGVFNFTGGAIHGQRGAGGQGGTFSLDVVSLPNLDSLDPVLNAGDFTLARTIRVRNGDVAINDTATAQSFNLSADQGSIIVNGTIDASGRTGGTIDLAASGSITLSANSLLTVEGQTFNDAGKGGAISLEAGSETNGTFNTSAYIDIRTGSVINLSVDANAATSAAQGDFTGTLHLRAPQLANGTGLQVHPINGTITGASNVVVEGYKIYVPAGGVIDNVEGTVFTDADNFVSHTATILSSLLNNTPNAAQASVFQITPGAEIINPSGNLTLNSDWDLSTFRFGSNAVPGVLTMRASGNLIFNGSLSDGFNSSAYNATLLVQNQLLPANFQSWSYRLAAGADLSAVDFHQVLPETETYNPATGLAVTGTNAGSLQLGNLITTNNGNAEALGGQQTGDVLDGFYQVIRTGTGDISIATAGDVLLRNQFATIYTAGAQVTDPTLGGTFSTPVLKQTGLTNLYPAKYSLAGGNVTVTAKGNIAHVTQNSSGTLVIDSEKELPNNWLYRRGYVDPATGQFGKTKNDTANNNAGSTSWWIDFSNFFEGVGALGGGNVSLSAGHDISNVDAVAPTNARVTNQVTVSGVVDHLAADQQLVELGGGDVLVQAGNDINGGAYYVERGQGTLSAGNSILTNSTRSASLGTLTSPVVINSSTTWLPTTLFLGKGNFNVMAGGDLLLGPVANPFLLPQGVNNTYWDKTYFSTYATSDAVEVTSLTGSVTLRESATLPGASVATPLLQNWFQNVDLLQTNPASVSSFQPWLNVTETAVEPYFNTVAALMPGTLQTTAFSGNINVVGNLTLSPSPTGTIDLVAAGSINALQPSGVTGTSTILNVWSSGTINLSDANPNAIPGVNSPYAYEVVVGTNPAAAQTFGGTVKINGVQVPVQLDLSFIDNLFAESGSTEGTHGVLQTKLQLHANINGGVLHANDPDPVHLYAQNGDISGLTLFSGKAADVVAGQDITDIALYVQNVNTSDISLVAAGRDLVAYDANSLLRAASLSIGNELASDSPTLAGDIQISGPGTLEVLAGRDLNLGVGPNNSDGTGVGITSIGNARDPLLPFGGANIAAGAGIGAAGFDNSQMSFSSFIGQYINPAAGAPAALYLPELGSLMGLSGQSNVQIWTAFNQLSKERQDALTIDIFYLVLRDAGRNHNSGSAGGYATAFAAISSLFPGHDWYGDISLTSREIKTASGGNINLFAPGGQLDVGLNVAGTQAVDQGILTEDGGNISIFTDGSVNVGTSRIFTLHGGNEIIWSSHGDIAAGASSKTVQSAPPTRVLIDPQSGDVQTDLAGLATGGGIGVLETVPGASPGNVDLIAPNGSVNAGDAGIRVSGNLNIAAAQILNAGNIQVGGKSSGISVVTPPNVAGLSSALTTGGAISNSANEAARQAANKGTQPQQQDSPSIFTVEVIGYGGGSDEDTSH